MPGIYLKHNDIWLLAWNGICQCKKQLLLFKNKVKKMSQNITDSYIHLTNLLSYASNLAAYAIV